MIDSSQTTRPASDTGEIARWCRSLAVTRGPSLERLYTVQTTTADIILYDLEDGVHPRLKDEARRAFQTVRGEQLRRPLGLRINSPCTDEGQRDLNMLESASTQPLVIVLPKVEDARDVQIADDLLTRTGSQAWLWAIVESGRGIMNAHQIAQASPRLAA